MSDHSKKPSPNEFKSEEINNCFSEGHCFYQNPLDNEDKQDYDKYIKGEQYVQIGSIEELFANNDQNGNSSTNNTDNPSNQVTTDPEIQKTHSHSTTSDSSNSEKQPNEDSRTNILRGNENESSPPYKQLIKKEKKTAKNNKGIALNKQIAVPLVKSISKPLNSFKNPIKRWNNKELREIDALKEENSCLISLSAYAKTSDLNESNCKETIIKSSKFNQQDLICFRFKILFENKLREGNISITPFLALSNRSHEKIVTVYVQSNPLIKEKSDSAKILQADYLENNIIIIQVFGMDQRFITDNLGFEANMRSNTDYPIIKTIINSLYNEGDCFYVIKTAKKQEYENFLESLKSNYRYTYLVNDKGERIIKLEEKNENESFPRSYTMEGEQEPTNKDVGIAITNVQKENENENSSHRYSMEEEQEPINFNEHIPITIFWEKNENESSPPIYMMERKKEPANNYEDIALNQENPPALVRNLISYCSFLNSKMWCEKQQSDIVGLDLENRSLLSFSLKVKTSNLNEFSGQQKIIKSFEFYQKDSICFRFQVLSKNQQSIGQISFAPFLAIQNRSMTNQVTVYVQISPLNEKNSDSTQILKAVYLESNIIFIDVKGIDPDFDTHNYGFERNMRSSLKYPIIETSIVQLGNQKHCFFVEKHNNNEYFLSSLKECYYPSQKSIDKRKGKEFEEIIFQHKFNE